MRTIFLTLFFYGSIVSISAQSIAIQEVLYNQGLGSDKFELVNTTGGTIDISTWWICARFVYRQLGSATDIEVIQGSLNLAPGAHVKLRLVNMDLNNVHSDFCLYLDSNFPSTASMIDYINYGCCGDVGRGSIAVTKGIWRDLDPGAPFVLDSIAHATGGNSVNWDGSNSGGGELTFGSDLFNAPPTLPISLLTLSGTVNINKQVVLKWIALDEFNSQKHIVEKSINGQDYEIIGEVSSQNLGSTPAHYTFIDESPLKNALSYYRIRQVDYDGLEKLSSTLYMKVKDVEYHKIAIAPNPISGIACFSMEFYWPNEDPLAEFRIVDMTGKMVEFFTEPLFEGYNNVMHQFYGIEPGQYMMILSDDEDNYAAEYFIIGK